MNIEVLQQGMLTTVQDLGRHTYQQYGVPVGGAMDTVALRIANMLVGNEEGEAGLEITIIGPKLLIKQTTLIAIGGANMEPLLNGKRVPLWRPVLAKEGSMLCFKKIQSGCRAYVAFAGGIHVPAVMKSKSTYMRASLGGLDGRALQKGDQLQIGTPSLWAKRLIQQLVNERRDTTMWGINSNCLPNYHHCPEIRVVEGLEFERFTGESLRSFFTKQFKISNHADRMGYRIDGEQVMVEGKLELLSDTVTHGTIQVPPEGQPIILMTDRQTTGGYPRIANVISIDIPLLAQLKPGDYLSFSKISVIEAQKLYIKQEQTINLLKMFIKLKGEKS
ncbi:biotin-dependent carboxyltransferase family protein [Bacillus sp. S14(2024)]|uniref:5-oxoprolinase subunit C family protein n=1 Tax=Bacillus sp. S14(2024) TaxID=3162884 RepID=UPI003D1C021F